VVAWSSPRSKCLTCVLWCVRVCVRACVRACVCVRIGDAPRPVMVVLDESTNAMTAEEEARVYSMCRRRGVTILSVGHRESLRAHHDIELRVGHGGSWALTPCGGHGDGVARQRHTLPSSVTVARTGGDPVAAAFQSKDMVGQASQASSPAVMTNVECLASLGRSVRGGCMLPEAARTGVLHLQLLAWMLSLASRALLTLCIPLALGTVCVEATSVSSPRQLPVASVYMLVRLFFLTCAVHTAHMLCQRSITVQVWTRWNHTVWTTVLASRGALLRACSRIMQPVLALDGAVRQLQRTEAHAGSGATGHGGGSSKAAGQQQVVEGVPFSPPRLLHASTQLANNLVPTVDTFAQLAVTFMLACALRSTGPFAHVPTTVLVLVPAAMLVVRHAIFSALSLSTRVAVAVRADLHAAASYHRALNRFWLHGEAIAISRGSAAELDQVSAWYVDCVVPPLS